jgi:hypothetical protein
MTVTARSIDLPRDRAGDLAIESHLLVAALAKRPEQVALGRRTNSRRDLVTDP